MESSEVLKNISLIVASWSVFVGVNAWRREFVGKRRIEVAENALVLFYEARDAIRGIRSPGGYVGEGKTRQQGENETPQEKEILDQAYVLIERYKQREALFSKIYAMRYKYMAIFGKEKSKPFDILHGVVTDLLSAAHRISRYRIQEMRRGVSDSGAQEHFERVHDAEGIYWEGMSEEDPINPRVKEAVTLIEKNCQAVMKLNQTPWARFLNWIKNSPGEN